MFSSQHKTFIYLFLVKCSAILCKSGTADEEMRKNMHSSLDAKWVNLRPIWLESYSIRHKRAKCQRIMVSQSVPCSNHDCKILRFSHPLAVACIAVQYNAARCSCELLNRTGAYEQLGYFPCLRTFSPLLQRCCFQCLTI